MLKKLWSLLSKTLCLMGIHDWRNGPGTPCTLCGQPDTFWDKE